MALTKNASQKSIVSIHVDNYSLRDGYFYPGQTITGKVVYEIHKEQEDLRDVSIEFYGNVKTAVTIRTGNSSQREREQIRLFHFRKNLYSNNFTVKAQTLSWPFEFEIPLAASYQRRDDVNPAFARSGAQTLPPSYYHGTDSFGKDGEGYVKYKLKAHVNASKTFGSKVIELPITLRRTLDYTSLPDQQTDLRRFMRQSWQSRSLRQHTHTFGQKISHVFGNDPELRNPSINFNAVMQLPTVTSPSQRGDIRLFLTQIREGPTDPQSPNLVLGHARLTLQGLTVIRVERKFWTDSHYDDGKDQVSSALFRPNDPLESRSPLPLDGSPTVIAPNWAFSDVPLQGRIVPDFNTWTISHVHRLKVELEIVHVDSGHVFKLEGKWPCRIIANEVRILQSAAELPGQDQKDEEEQLPAYSAASAGPSDAPPPSLTPPPTDIKQTQSG